MYCLILLIICSHVPNTQARIWIWASSDAMPQLQANPGIVTDVSVSTWALSSGGNITGSLNTTLDNALKTLGVKRYPLMFSEDIAAIRTILADPEPFLESITRRLQQSDVDGLNLDFEPYDKKSQQPTATHVDGENFAAFVQILSKRIHAIGKELTIDVFLNNPFWDVDALNATDVDLLISMDTYVHDINGTFASYVSTYSGHLKPEKFGIGISSGAEGHGPFGPGCTGPYGPHPCRPAWTASGLQELNSFLSMHSAAFRMINVFSAPFPPMVWTALHNFSYINRESIND